MFLFLTSPFGFVREASLFNLLILGVLGVTIFVGSTSTSKDFVQWFKVKNRRDFLGDAGLGVILGFVGLVLWGLFSNILTYGMSLLGGTNVSLLSSTTIDGAIFGVFINPITEVFLLVGIGLALHHYLPKKMVFKVLISIFVVSMIFAGIHFNAKQNYAESNGIVFPYESSISGVATAIFDVQNLGSENYVGMFPQLILGMFWIGLGFGFKSFIVPIFAHWSSNVYISYVNTSNPEVQAFIFGILALLVILTLIALQQGLVQRELKTFKGKVFFT